MAVAGGVVMATVAATDIGAVLAIAVATDTEAVMVGAVMDTVMAMVIVGVVTAIGEAADTLPAASAVGTAAADIAKIR
jgi:hypothetical protein